MPYYLLLVLVIIESFLLGSIPCGVLIGRFVYKSDPRSGGSGSIGATNMGRLFGVKAGLGTFVCDMGKGAIAVALARLIMALTAPELAWQAELVLIAAVAGSIFGHVFTPWLHFKGGKGISAGFGSLLVAFPVLALTALAVFIIVVAITKIVSAGSICAAIAFPIFSCIYHWGSVPIIAFSIVIAVAVCCAHKGNIQRMMAGTEPRISFKHTDKAS